MTWEPKAFPPDACFNSGGYSLASGSSRGDTRRGLPEAGQLSQRTHFHRRTLFLATSANSQTTPDLRVRQGAYRRQWALACPPRAAGSGSRPMKEAVMTGAPSRHGHRIVVGVDGSAPSKVALAWGIEQAARTGAQVQAVIAWYWFPMPIQPIQDADFKGLAEDLLTEAIRETVKCPPDVKIDSAVTLGDPSRVLLEASHGADMLVVGNRGKGGLREALLGSVSQYCVQHATCPVAVLREASHLHDHERRIVVGVDGSRSSKAALRWAIRQASITDMDVEAIAAWTIPTYYGYSLFADGVQADDIAGPARRMIIKTIDEVGGADAEGKITSAVIHGDAAQVLVDASARAALLVLGNRGHSVLAEALLGSVSQRCVHHATCPVVIVQDSPRHRA